MHFTAIQIITDFLYSAMWFVVLGHTHPRRFSRRATLITLALWFVFYLIVTRSLSFMSELRVSMGFFSFFAISLILYADPWPRVLFTTAMICLLVFTNEIIGVALYFPPEALAGTPELLSAKGQILFYGPYLVVGALLFFLLYLFLNRYKFSLGKNDWLLFAVFPVSQGLLMFGWLDAIRTTADESRVVFFIIAIAAAVIADVGIFLSVRHIAQRAQLKAENEQLALQVEAQEKHYADLTAQY